MMTKKIVLSASVAALLASTAMVRADAMADLEAAAKAEGSLTTIALPHDWCGYGAVIDGFKAKYPKIAVNELNPDAGSADEVEAIKANKDNKGPQAPDVIDVGLAFGPQIEGRRPDQPYKVATWDEIPDNIKDADGHWYGDYYGVMSFLVNKDLVAKDPGRLGRSAEARVCQPGCPGGRSACVEPGDPGGSCGRSGPRRCGG
jgi:putative spermidine/putrescine transport system substrate-binding protein